MQSILFLSTLNLATNPRLVKEINLALTQKMKVYVICFEFSNWSAANNKLIKKDFESKGVILHSIPAGRWPFMQWVFSVINEKASGILVRIFKSNKYFLPNALSRRNILLLKALKKIPGIDWVVGHNAGALWATLSAGKKFNCRMGFDIEDYHPGEGLNARYQALCRKMMSIALPHFKYVSFASPLIKSYTQNLLHKENPAFVINNFFSKNDFVLENPQHDKLQLVWFSQNIDFGRGLEEFLLAYDEFKDQFDLTLIGNTKPSFYEKHLKNRKEIIILNSMTQAELNKTICKFDIGLAIECGKDLNYQIALSNKMLAYFQAGLYIFASNTQAQNLFIEKHPQHGINSSLKNDQLKSSMENLLKNKNSIRETKKERFKNASVYNWENESIALLNQWKRLKN